MLLSFFSRAFTLDEQTTSVGSAAIAAASKDRTSVLEQTVQTGTAAIMFAGVPCACCTYSEPFLARATQTRQNSVTGRVVAVVFSYAPFVARQRLLCSWCLFRCRWMTRWPQKRQAGLGSELAGQLSRLCVCRRIQSLKIWPHP